MSKTGERDESLRPALTALAARDRDLARALAHCGLPLPRGHRPGFGGLLKIICCQQVSAASARAIVERLDALAEPLAPEVFLALDEAAYRQIGLSRQKIRYGRLLAEALLEGALDLTALQALDDRAAAAALTAITGIGRWTAEIYLLFAERRADIWPAGDLAVQVAVQRLKSLPARPNVAEMDRLAEPWRPHRSAAARFLWHYYRHPGVTFGAAP